MMSAGYVVLHERITEIKIMSSPSKGFSPQRKRLLRLAKWRQALAPLLSALTRLRDWLYGL
jgi:hypothetical protein